MFHHSKVPSTATHDFFMAAIPNHPSTEIDKGSRQGKGTYGGKDVSGGGNKSTMLEITKDE